ncbi:MAG: ATP-grasp domain-containing protein, partial [Chloroflexota bacterium]
SKRVLLLVSSKSYRSAAFLAAAERLGLQVVQAVDLPTELAAYWHVELGVPFSQPAESARALAPRLADTPLAAVVPVDDGATLLAAHLSDLLHLASNPPESALAARDKLLMRRCFAAAGVPSPEFEPISLDANPQLIAEEAAYPCVLKPLRLSGSRGVIRANNAAEFSAAFARIRRMLVAEAGDDGGQLLVERFIPGREVALEGLLSAGSLRVLALFDKPDPLDGPFFEETLYVTPSRLAAATQRQIAVCAEAAARAVGLREGPVHAELRVNEAGPWMVELAGRSIGGLCSSILEFGSGMPLEELILRHFTGLPAGAELARGAVGVMMIPIPGSGRFRGCSGIEAAQAVPLVRGVEISIRPNQRIVALPEGASYLGFIFARGDTPAQVEIALREAHGCLRFDIEPELPLLALHSFFGPQLAQAAAGNEKRGAHAVG